jgi:hypothetical protein
MATQKQIVADVRAFAQGLGCTCTVRKNGYGEYEARVKHLGDRDYALHYFTDDFTDAVDTANFTLNAIEREQRREREGQRKQAEARRAQYAQDLQTAVDQVQTILGLVGCRVERGTEIDSLNIVTMYSPKTGTHSLNMTFGVRPVSDLIAHAVGFADQQTKW